MVLAVNLLEKLNVNFDAKNITEFREEEKNEIHGAIGYLSEIELIKKNYRLNSESLLKPKLLLKYAPGSMRKETEGQRLTNENIFSLDRSNQSYNLEKGFSASVGFDYELTKEDKQFVFSLGQVIKDKEDNNMAASTSLQKKLSDLVGSSNLKINDNLSIKYNFSLDNNYNDLNYNEVVSTLNFDKLRLDFNYLQEKQHIGNNEYFKTNLSYEASSNQRLSFENVETY